VDRIEGAVLVALAAAFLVAMAVASVLGVHSYRSQRAASAGLRPVVAVLSRPPVGTCRFAKLISDR
jgi:predicted lysophospholipase L1 biosynthesis ABC-type transport system permease subunit